VLRESAIRSSDKPQRGMIYSSRPSSNDFRARTWPYRLVTMPMGDTFRLLRRIYHSILGSHQCASLRIYQEFECNIMMGALLERPEGFLMETERFAMSVIFSLSFGVRLARLDHPIMKEYYAIWESMLTCKHVENLPGNHELTKQTSNQVRSPLTFFHSSPICPASCNHGRN
jgi:hypothetical protein